MNKEELLQKIADKWGLCTCIDAYKLRGLYAPDCAWHSGCVEEAMEEYAIAMCEAQKEACSENADIHWPAENNLNPCVDKQSILNTKNVAE